MRNKILIDIDGTITSLGDYVMVFHDIIKSVAMKMGVDIGEWDPWKIYNSFLASGYVNSEKNLRMVGLDPGRFWNEVAKEDCKEREKHYGKMIKPYDDVSVLREMAGNGFVLGIMTDQPEVMAYRYVKRFKLDFFKAVVCGNYISELSKPDSLGVELLMKRMGATREDSVMVGDSDQDVIAARRAGIPVIQISRKEEPDYGPPEPDVVIKTFHELPEAIKTVSGD
jgi:phosphoglycolate phosphatase-like HAD superfamily hydrolase